MIALYPDAVSHGEIQRFSEELAALVDAGPLDTPVTTCGDWTLADLAWHLMEVQDFWAFIISNRPDGPQDYAQPPRPIDAALGQGLRSATTALVGALSSCRPETPAWSWHSADQTAGFSIRRQTHEALVHCVDGAAAVGADLPGVSPELGADGVDEVVNVMLCGTPEWAQFMRTRGIVEMRATDTADSWTVALGRIAGDRPDGTHVDTASNERADGEPADLTVSGSAVDLDLWLWGRSPAGTISLDGATELAQELRTPIN